MNVLYDHTVFAIQRYGGISRYFNELIPRVADVPGVDVSAFMGFYLSRYGLERHSGRFRHFFGLRRPAIPKTHRLAVGAANVLLPRLARRWQPDVYHTTSYGAPQYDAARDGVPGKRVVTIHDLTAERLPHLFPAAEARGDVKRRLARGSDGVVCISEATRRDAVELLGVPEARTAVIYHANSLTTPAGAARPVEQPYVLFVGMRAAYKNFDRLLDALARGARLPPDLRLACFGGGPLTAAERERLAAAKLENRVHLFGGGDEVLAGLYAHALAFVYPSLYEGFGIPLLEAMHYGCPVLASRIASFVEVAGAAVLYFDPEDSEDLADKLAKLLDDSALRGGLISAGRQREKQFSWERCARETVDFYKAVRGGPAHD